jgi:two-component system, OmpR family, sensor histidine kinase ChvG
MLDKLAANAVEFSAPGSAIRFELRREAASVRLSVFNEGPPLPADMQDRLFESMISVRDKQAQGEPHLGLGLYIVRLIAEFHGARATARNLDDGSGVEIRVEFPLADNTINT